MIFLEKQKLKLKKLKTTPILEAYFYQKTVIIGKTKILKYHQTGLCNTKKTFEFYRGKFPEKCFQKQRKKRFKESFLFQKTNIPIGHGCCGLVSGDDCDDIMIVFDWWLLFVNDDDKTISVIIYHQEFDIFDDVYHKTLISLDF